MFNKKEEIPAPSGIHNVFSAGTILTGNLVTQDDIRIDGVIEGNITSKGKIIIGNNGHIAGDIECNTLDLLGKVSGNIECEDTLILRSTSNLIGDIISKTLEIETGARFTGSCKMKD